jgi:hypothetical protein
MAVMAGTEVFDTENERKEHLSSFFSHTSATDENDYDHE